MMNYCNKVILAPMVRGSRMPARLQALRYGADLVYTDEMIDATFLTSERRVNEILNTIDYVHEAQFNQGYSTFRTCAEEKDRLIFQLGTTNPDVAVAAAKLVQNDVSGIDVNMGCPKPYSTQIGMGATLLYNPENAKNILKSLVKNIPLPITCKIRIFDDVDESVKLAKELESTGITAIAVHGRTKSQKCSHPVNKDAIRRIAESVKIPVIANGGSEDIECYDDVERFRSDCGASSAMIARAAQRNISVFRKEGLLPIEEVARDYLKLCIQYDNSIANTKFVLQTMYKYNVAAQRKSDFVGRALHNTKSLAQICHYWDLGELCEEVHEGYKAKGLIHLPCSPQRKLENFTEDVIKLRMQILQSQRENNTCTQP